MTPLFQPGIKLCEQFYWRCVRPILDTHFPGVPHAAALIDSGSEVLGFDDAMSTDHVWGPRVMLFVQPANHLRFALAVKDILALRLPHEFEGYPTDFAAPGTGVRGVSCQTFWGFIAECFILDSEQPMEPVDWLTVSEQRLGTLTAGPVYFDAIGLSEARACFNYSPRDVWLYLLAAGWVRLGQEDHLMGRAGFRGDELGCAFIGARLLRDIMRLCFLMERTYAPYSKWFGTAFGQLAAALRLAPVLTGALQGQTWLQREGWLVRAYEALAARHNALGLTAPLPEAATSFFGRPFQVMGLHGFAEALLRQIHDPRVQTRARLPLIGSLDLFSDSTDLTSNPFWRPRLRRLYTD